MQALHRVGRYRDMQGRGWHIWVRRALLTLKSCLERAVAKET